MPFYPVAASEKTRTEEEVVGVGTLTADAEQLEEVKELAVDVTADLWESSNRSERVVPRSVGVVV